MFDLNYVMTSYLQTTFSSSPGSRSVISAPPQAPIPFSSDPHKMTTLDSLLSGMPVSVNRKSVNKGVEVRTSVHMRDNERKFGFSIYGGANASLYPRIDGISPDSPSSRADIQIGDEVLAVNGNSLQFLSHQQIITAIHKSIQTGSVSLLLKRDASPSALDGVTANTYHLQNISPTSPYHNQPPYLSHPPQQPQTPISAPDCEDVNHPRPSSSGCNSLSSRNSSKEEAEEVSASASSHHHSFDLGAVRTSSNTKRDRNKYSSTASDASSNLSHQPNSCSSTSGHSSPAIPLPLPALTSWKSRDELNQLNSFNLPSQPRSNLQTSDEQTTEVTKSSNLLEDGIESEEKVYELDVDNNIQQTYQRKYKKRTESEQLNSLTRTNQYSSALHPSSPAVPPADSTTLDFDLSNRQRNYPRTQSTHSPSEDNNYFHSQNSSMMYGGQSDVDFMLTSEPIVSRQPFIDAMGAGARGNNSYHDVRNPRNSRQPGQFREMPIDCPGEEIAMTYPYERSPLPGQLNGYHNHNNVHSGTMGTNFPPAAQNRNHRFARPAGGRQNVSSPLMYDERHTETTSIDVDSPDEGALVPGMYDTTRSNNRTTSTHLTNQPLRNASSLSGQQLIHMKDDMQYKTDFSQIPSFIASLPSQDSSSEALQRSLNSDVFKRSLVHFEAINRFNTAVSTQSKSSLEGDDAASSTCGERLFTPASEVTFNRPPTATGGTQSTSPKLLPTTLQVQQIIKDSNQPSEEGIELYKVLDEQNMQAVLKAHEQLVHRESSRLQQKAPPLKPKPPKTATNGHARDSSDLYNGTAPLITSLHNSTVTATRGGGGTLESSLTSDMPPEVIDKGDGTRLVILQKSHHPLGATILKDGDTIKIGRIVKGGIIEASGVMREGEEIVKINEIELNRAMSVDDVCDILASLTGRVHFLLKLQQPLASSPSTHGLSNGKTGSGGYSLGETYNARTNTATSIFDEQILHIRALFDFNPEDDEYVPCRDLGIPFDRGTVLHVMSTQDPHWWQAFPDHVIGLSSANESGATGSLLAIQNQNTLAGLIPSKKFWRKREALRLMIEANEQSHESFNEKKSNSLCCSNRSRRNTQSRTHFGGGPYINPSAVEVLTYEEVGLFRPEEAPPRPVILVGPSKIGRHELRQRLYVRQPEYFGFAVPHTTRPAKSAEQDGVDYHFVSRKEFETELNNELMVGFHELGKHLFGTSVKAIQQVMVKSKKSCVLSLHPRSIQALRDAMLMPFVIFIAPPNLESLRNVSREIGNTLKDTELRAVIEEARVLDLQYGHLFDDVIINSNLDQCFQQLSMLCEKLRTEPQWVPVEWLGRTPSPLLAEEDN